MIIFLTFLLITILSLDIASATDYKPWYGPVLEIDTQADILMQAFDHVDSHGSSGNRPEFDTFIDLSAAVTVWEGIAAELEVIAAETRHQSFGMDAIRLTGRYLWLDDVTGDPVSLSTGITLSTVFEACRRNIATFDHGSIECEGHIAVGKETSSMQFWTSRWWGVFGIGLADVGSPWLRANVAWEHNWWNNHQVKLFADSIWGLGGNNLNQKHFHGYGSIAYQAVDIGARYLYRFCNGLALSAGYAFRVYGRNCPQCVNTILLHLDYPLGL